MADVLWTSEEHLDVLRREILVKVDDLSQVNEAYLGGCFRAPLVEDRVNNVEEHRSELSNGLLVNFDCLNRTYSLEVTGSAHVRTVRD